MFGRDEKVSAIRLTAAQYIILGIFLDMAAHILITTPLFRSGACR